MEWGILVPIAAITIGPIAWAANNWVRAKHGFEPQTYKESDGESVNRKQVRLLTSENERMAGQMSRLEERIAILERIATDPAERTAREIDALR